MALLRCRHEGSTAVTRGGRTRGSQCKTPIPTTLIPHHNYLVTKARGVSPLGVFFGSHRTDEDSIHRLIALS